MDGSSEVLDASSRSSGTIHQASPIVALDRAGGRKTAKTARSETRRVPGTRCGARHSRDSSRLTKFSDEASTRLRSVIQSQTHAKKHPLDARLEFLPRAPNARATPKLPSRKPTRPHPPNRQCSRRVEKKRSICVSLSSTRASRRSIRRPSLTSLDLLDGQTRGQGLLELVRLVGVVDAQRVQVLRAAHLELGARPGLLDLHALRILAARREEEILDLVDLLRLLLDEQTKGRHEGGSGTAVSGRKARRARHGGAAEHLCE